MANQEETRIIETTARMHMCLMSAREGMRLKESEGVRYHDMKPHVPQHEEANDDDVYENFLHLSRPRKDLMLGDDEGVDIPTNPKSKSAKGYIARQRVSISGLISDVSLNGRQGTLVEWSDKTQRWLVNVDEKEDFVPVSVKPANLELVRPGPYKPRYWPAGVHIRELVFHIGSHPPVAKLARHETGDEDEVNGNAQADERPLTDEELGSRVLFSGALIDLRGEFKLATVVSLYSRKAYDGEDWEEEKFHLQKIQKGPSPDHWSAHVGAMPVSASCSSSSPTSSTARSFACLIPATSASLGRSSLSAFACARLAVLAFTRHDRRPAVTPRSSQRMTSSPSKVPQARSTTERRQAPHRKHCAW